MSVEHVHALAKGARLNQYEMMTILGTGGFGITYMARDTTLDTIVAIKEYMPGELATRLGDSTITVKSSTSKGDFDWGLDRFLEEARVLAKFRHPNIVRVNQIFQANNSAYIVMDYAKGESLDDMLRRTGPLSEQQTKDILLPILDGLKRVHELGFLHRDIKPGNIIIRDEGGAVLIDFGAARKASGSKTRALTSIVTEGYAPLEQYDAAGNQGPWTDIYALGGVAYKCLTGNKPPSATSRVRTDPLVPLAIAAPGRVSAEFAAAIEAALRVHESERPQNINEFLALVSGATVVVASPPPVDATVIMRPDVMRAVQSASVKPDAPVSMRLGVPASVKSDAPAPRAVGKGGAAYLALAAGVVLVVAAGGWFYLQTVQPVTTVKEVSLVDRAAPPSAGAIPAVPPAAAPSTGAGPAVPPATAPSPIEQAPSPPNGAAGAARPAVPQASAPSPTEQPSTRPEPRPAPPQQRTAQPNPIPPLPATPARAITMLKSFSDPVFKAALAQPGLRSRVETLMGLEGCDWRVNANVASQATTRQAGTYLNGMNDDDLRAALSDGVLLDRIDAAFGRGSCTFTQQTEPSTNGFPQPNNSKRNPGGSYPNGAPGDYGQRPNGGGPIVPGTPYGGYGGYGPGYIPR